MKKKMKRRLLYVFGASLLAYLFFYFQNNALVTTEYTIRSEDVPNSFDGYTIVHLSDLHGKYFGDNQSILVEKTADMNPDMIVFTGDIVDEDRYDEQAGQILMEKLTEMAPVYYVTGNHEWKSGRFGSLEKKLQGVNVTVLRNKTEEIVVQGESIRITGIDDPTQANGFSQEEETAELFIKEALADVSHDDGFHMLLSHRPELASLYARYDMDAVFSGHAHGGQFRIPFVGGVIAPNQGLFPEYDGGAYAIENTTMMVHRGLGNSVIPVRIFNRPEIVVVTLNKE
ncbi:hypothetical protein SAMN05192534_1094 [Alteribacillus persepolensis]|uniref:Calcineurin-like phosphoesterase domain-containing protein n=1 Tax=Alteribacillus persepolensis TaxID=568899 RepID=A0A1G8EA75_9BACI|nr:metallophosphoesterase [Alteribacillus persepolensis]SDH66806.1 hypothetical protein SAMN05192534_1094 [Alteribacillus persepolensis]